MKEETFNYSPQEQEEMMQKLRNEFNERKENYDGSLILRPCNDDYDIIANLLIIDMNHIKDKEKKLFSIGENNFTTNQYYSELFTKTPFGIEFVKDYVNGKILFQQEDKKQKYLIEKKKLHQRKRLPYYIAIGIGLLFLVALCTIFS